MKCPTCGTWTEVLETRKREKGAVLRRRRQCANGCPTFTTVERVVAVRPARAASSQATPRA